MYSVLNPPPVLQYRLGNTELVLSGFIIRDVSRYDVISRPSEVYYRV